MPFGFGGKSSDIPALPASPCLILLARCSARSHASSLWLAWARRWRCPGHVRVCPACPGYPPSRKVIWHFRQRRLGHGQPFVLAPAGAPQGQEANCTCVLAPPIGASQQQLQPEQEPQISRARARRLLMAYEIPTYMEYFHFEPLGYVQARSGERRYVSRTDKTLCLPRCRAGIVGRAAGFEP